MKYGEVYGAISRRLNKGIDYINLKIIDDEVEADDDDIQAVINEMWKNGLVRRINKDEYELVCDMGQLREYITEKENEGMENGAKGEYDECADKPMCLDSIAESDWRLAEKPDDKADSSKRVSPFDALRQRRNNGRKSIFDLDDEDEEESLEQKIRLLSYIRETNNYNEEEKTLEPEMRVLFPKSDIPLVLDWKEDSDGDLYLTDRGCLYNYLLGRIDKDGGCECTRDFVELLLVDLEKKSSFSRESTMLINYLTGVKDRDRLRIEVNYYTVQYGKYISSLGWLFDPIEEGTGDFHKDVDKKIDLFVKSYNENSNPSLAEAISAGSRARAYVRKIQQIDPRITREQAIKTANMLKEKILKEQLPTAYIAAINEAITQLNVSTNRAYNVGKLDLYTAA